MALQVAALTLLLATLIGGPLGMLSGNLGGGLDRLLVLVMDTLYTLPVLLLLVVLAFLLGKGLPNAAAALYVVYVPQYFRVVRNRTAQVKSELFVEAAHSLGARPLWILRRYLFRNVITTVPVLLSLNAADAVLVLGGLGFLGQGLPESIPEWGSDLHQALGAGSGALGRKRSAMGAKPWPSIQPWRSQQLLREQQLLACQKIPRIPGPLRLSRSRGVLQLQSSAGPGRNECKANIKTRICRQSIG